MSEPQQNQDEELREFESAANKEAIERQHAMEAAERTCLGLRIEIQELTKERDAERVRTDKAEAELAVIRGTPWEQDRKKLVDFLQCNWPDLTSVDAWPADRAIGALRLLVREKEKAEAACAEKDEILGSLESDIDSALQKECLCASISSEHGCPSCDAFTRIFRKANHALSTDCGKGWKSPEEYAALAKELQGEREHVEGYVSELDKHAWEKYHNDKNHNPAGWRCLAYNCIHTLKRQSVPASELDKTIEVLDKLSRLGNEPLVGNSVGNCIAKSEHDRLESVRKEL